jgi:hypothetical protein
MLLVDPVYTGRIREAKTQSCEGHVDNVSLRDHLPHHRPIFVLLPIDRSEVVWVNKQLGRWKRKCYFFEGENLQETQM